VSNVDAYVIATVDAVKNVIRLGKVLGLGELLPDQVEEVKEKVTAAINDTLDELLPLAIVGVAVGAVAVATKVQIGIDSLGEVPACPKCGAIALQHASYSPHTGKSEVTLSCSCGWTGPG
jgi:predicted RNA-binding Zn-ribbon protein involved in translation (DUF1610 family)